MLTAITYNCNPESLSDISQEAFSEAFENEIRVKPIYRDLAVTVTFNAGKSEVTSFGSDDFEADVSHENEFRETFERLAGKAFSACCCL